MEQPEVPAMRRTMTMDSIWVEGVRVERPARRERVDGLGRRIWMLGWGLLFVVGMTVLSEWGPRVAYSKVPPAPAVSDPMVKVVK